MKKFILLLLVCFSLMSFTPFQSGREEMITALKQGNAEQFVKYFDNTIDIKMPDSDEMKGVQKTQAAGTLKSFFADNGINQFDILFKIYYNFCQNIPSIARYYSASLKCYK